MGRNKKQFISQEYSAETGGKNLKEGTRKSRVVTYITTAFFSLTIVIGISLVSFTVVFFFSEVKGPSMMKAINADFRENGNTDSVIVNRYKKPARGDIIVVKHSNGDYHIKRLICLGGESIHLRLVDNNGNTVQSLNQGVRYIFEIDGVNYDNVLYNLDPYLGRNMRNSRYDLLYEYQQGVISVAQFTDNRTGNPEFRIADHRGVEFRQFRVMDEDGKTITWKTEPQPGDIGRWEFRLPKDYIFYMGDNRGGSGIGDDFWNMSLDCTWFGPQRQKNIVGTVTEVIHDKTAPQWFWDKVVWAFSLRWI